MAGSLSSTLLPVLFGGSPYSSRILAKKGTLIFEGLLGNQDGDTMVSQKPQLP